MAANYRPLQSYLDKLEREGIVNLVLKKLWERRSPVGLKQLVEEFPGKTSTEVVEGVLKARDLGYISLDEGGSQPMVELTLPGAQAII
jgi:hypothetical protein